MSEGLQGIQVHLVDNSETAAEFMRWAGERRPLDAIGLDTETGELPGEPSNGALSPWHGDLRLVQIGDGMQGWSIPWLEWKGVFYEWAKQHTGPIVMHNCFTGDTEFLTAAGPKTLKEMSGKRVKVWDGASWSKSVPPRTTDGSFSMVRRPPTSR
jgi:hypothetical protein